MLGAFEAQICETLALCTFRKGWMLKTLKCLNRWVHNTNHQCHSQASTFHQTIKIMFAGMRKRRRKDNGSKEKIVTFCCSFVLLFEYTLSHLLSGPVCWFWAWHFVSFLSRVWLWK